MPEIVPGKRRVAIGMSGGVDSSVAAWLLKEQGYDVIGITMKVWLEGCGSRGGEQSSVIVEDAGKVAKALDIPHFVVDESTQFNKQVLGYLASEYQAGRTPNPCVVCNEKMKFGHLWDKARALGADLIATGHYAIIEHHADSAVLRKGCDPRKDQSYFLYRLRQDQLQYALTPLGGMEKPRIRELARKLALPVAEKADSQEICFIPDNDYRAFLKTCIDDKDFHRGSIYDKHGRFLAKHEGIEMFTIGQRKGLPGGSLKPQYVIDLDPETNSVIVGDPEDLASEEFEINSANWIDPRLHAADRAASFETTVKIRYSHPGTPATLYPGENNTARVRLHVPQRAVTPGQAAVFYDGDRVLGGGWISRRVIPQPAV